MESCTGFSDSLARAMDSSLSSAVWRCIVSACSLRKVCCSVKTSAGSFTAKNLRAKAKPAAKRRRRRFDSLGTTSDDDDHMPPRKSKLDRLTPAEIATLKRWIAEGAKWPQGLVLNYKTPEQRKAAHEERVAGAALERTPTVRIGGVAEAGGHYAGLLERVDKPKPP